MRVIDKQRWAAGTSTCYYPPGHLALGQFGRYLAGTSWVGQTGNVHWRADMLKLRI